MSAAIIIPAARDEDVDDVQCALTVAHACAERGDADDAVKWLRRASRAAADNDDVGRAVELSKAASEAEVAVQVAPRAAPSAPARQSAPAPRTAPARTRIDRPTPRRTPSPKPVPRTSPPAAQRAQRRPPAAQHLPTQPAARRPVAPQLPPQRPVFHSDLERTEPRLVLPQPAPAPPPDFALPPLVDDDLDEPTETKQRPSAPRKSDTRSTDPRVSWDSDIGSIADELEPTTCRVTDLTPLSATRVAVYPGISGRPEVVFLPAGHRPPPGAAVALIVPTSPEDAALLAAMVRVFEHGRAAS